MSKITNRRANFEYTLESDRIEGGLSLSGAEAKAIREGHADLSRSVVRLLNGEAWLINANIPSNQGQNVSPTRSRKLLLHKSEILSLATKMKQFKLTLVPLSLYTKGRLVKLKIALGKPKVKFEKREYLKKKDIERELEQELKGS
ncbi:MAG: SsrA-binding protein [Candidatus Woesebacteria bacterium GW2011_GWA1_45_8]|uniref:SsrA-binding protein n=1 Tax=Candidatus Woesebacteria bacterium GW2011_GWA1_45_8 TaxID=1618559 RepID=A0A0G1MVI4_9BACT|nr:MAG: SsrA-binding protein [Candidatus Woesebacteria bacterium GW2011_GWA1_45_8]